MEHLFSAHPQQGAAQQETGVCPREGQIRECCRQWFLTEGDVDDFIFYGTSIQIQQQIGNAVPPELAYRIAVQIREALRNV